jgi:hypothetical protein
MFYCLLSIFYFPINSNQLPFSVFVKPPKSPSPPNLLRERDLLHRLCMFSTEDRNKGKWTNKVYFKKKL